MSSTSEAKKDLPKPDHTLYYPIGNDDKGGCLMLFGKPEAKNLAILCAGFANDHSCFLPLASRLASDPANSLLAGVACLPGFDDRPPEKPWKSHPKDGYSFVEWANSLREAVKVMRGYSSSGGGAATTKKKKKLTGIFHDYGVVAGLMYTNRALADDEADKKTTPETSLAPDELVLFDVLTGVHPKTPGRDTLAAPPKKSWFRKAYETLATWSYRIVFANTFWLQRYVSGSLALLYMGLSFSVINLLRLSPSREVDQQAIKEHPVKDPYRLAYMTYPYYRLMRIVLGSSMRSGLPGGHLPIDLAKTPVLYMYGLDKNVMFHPIKAELLLRQEHDKFGRRSNAIGVEKAGHWLYLQQEDQCYAAMQKFMNGGDK